AFVIADRVTDRIAEVEECRVCINLDFAFEVVCFVRHNAEIEYHIAEGIFFYFFQFELRAVSGSLSFYAAKVVTFF
ncbi:hypothetical protein, partial [Bacillus pumilus]|uniref:hypothetical protein n=1 Tax=Bacillus pumilus TaxID=1408 RepID=UPI001C92D377